MSPAQIMALATVAVMYLAVGTAWSIAVWVTRVLNDYPVSWTGFFAQLLLWPWAMWLDWQDSGGPR